MLKWYIVIPDTYVYISIGKLYLSKMTASVTWLPVVCVRPILFVPGFNSFNYIFRDIFAFGREQVLTIGPLQLMSKLTSVNPFRSFAGESIVPNLENKVHIKTHFRNAVKPVLSSYSNEDQILVLSPIIA